MLRTKHIGVDKIYTKTGNKLPQENLQQFETSLMESQKQFRLYPVEKSNVE